MNKDLLNFRNNGSYAFIKDSQVIFKIEEIPAGLNLVDYWQFKNTIKKSIIGTVIKSFRVLNYLVFLYTVDRFMKNKKILLIAKLEFLQSIIQDEISSELWILNDRGFSCVGIVKGVPFFIRSFSSVYEVNDNLELMINALDVFHTTQSVRFFNCSQDDIPVKGLNVAEYSEDFMVNRMDGQTSVEQYVKIIPINNKHLNITKLKITTLLVSVYLIAAISDQIKYTLTSKVEDLQNELASMSYKEIPDIPHYSALVRLLNDT